MLVELFFIAAFGQHVNAAEPRVFNGMPACVAERDKRNAELALGGPTLMRFYCQPRNP